MLNVNILYLDTDNVKTTGYYGGGWPQFGADYRIVYRYNFMLFCALSHTRGMVIIMGKKRILSFVSLTMAFVIVIIFSIPGSKSYAANLNATNNMKVMVPAYFNASSSNWATLAAQASKMPGNLYAIANPNSGPGAVMDSSYQTVINNVRSNSGKILGYVSTAYGKRSEADIKSDIDKWFSWYSIDGIFLDEMQITTGHVQYYQDIYNYIKSKNSSALVVDNPGYHLIDSCYLFYNGSRVTDVLCIYENSIGIDNITPPSWMSEYSSENFYMLPYNISSSNWQSTIEKAATKNCGWIYCTDTLQNPWGTLPSYFEQMCNYIYNRTLRISNVQSSNIDQTSATIRWTTNTPANSSVDYGTTTSYGLNYCNSSNLTDHSLGLTGLLPNTTYHFKVTSTDANGNTSSSPDNTFTTLNSGSSIKIDGHFSDWYGISAYARDPQDCGGGSNDVKALTVTSENNNLYARLAVYGIFSMSNVNILYLDTDNVKTTGFYGGGWPQFGADYRIVYNNDFMPPKLQKFAGSSQGDDTWKDVATLNGAYSGNCAEIEIPYNLLAANSGQAIKLLFRVDSDSTSDSAPDFWSSSMPTYTLK